MKGDFTRDTFHPLKHYMRVLMQQGRVQLDADWNEQAAILLHYLRAFVADFHGPYGAPPFNAGFSITPIPGASDFFIGGGDFYVAGMLCEAGFAPIPITPVPDNKFEAQIPEWAVDNQALQQEQYVEVFDAASPKDPAAIPAKIDNVDAQTRTLTLGTDVSAISSYAAPRIRRIPTYLTQPDYLVPDVEKLHQPGSYQVYLDVWERLMTYVEDDGIREVALGGPDTAVRTKLVWQVKVWQPSGWKGASCVTGQQLNDEFQPENRGHLKAWVGPGSVSTDPCVMAPDARYRGAENQLYRVEIHRSGRGWDGQGDPRLATGATFKWSRENGSVILPIVSLVTSSGGSVTVSLENLGRDDRFGLQEGDWVEVEDDDYVLQNRADNLCQVQSIDRTDLSVSLTGTPDLTVGADLSKHPLLRRWDHKAGEPAEGGLELGSDGAALIVEGRWLNLEDGVQVWFQPPDDDKPNQYRTGDYWLIPARTATGNVEWPTVKEANGSPMPMAVLPHGIVHHYAPLALIKIDDAQGELKLTAKACGNPV